MLLFFTIARQMFSVTLGVSQKYLHIRIFTPKILYLPFWQQAAQIVTEHWPKVGVRRVVSYVMDKRAAKKAEIETQ
jgi:hypothetical protein